MDATNIDKLRQRLLDLKVELLTMADASREDTQPVELDQARVGRLSRMDAMQAQEMAQATARRREQRLAQVEGALRRMESGDFGICFACGEEIDPRRLALDPTATRCIGCME
jgi:DnaK suppressor protein